MYQNIFVDGDTVYLWDSNKGFTVLKTNDYRYAYKKSPHGQNLSFTGVKCSKIYKFSKNDTDLFESDLPIETRVLTDVYLNDDTPSEGHRLVFIDIEVSSKDGFPNVETVNNKIVSIALYDWITKEYFVYVLGNKTSYKKDNVTIRFFDEEYDLLYHFLDLWEGINPTIVSGWNSDHFDVPYLYKRIGVVLGLSNANRLSSISRIKFSQYREKYQIAGVSCLDYLDLYKKFTYSELPNYRLDTVARMELGEEEGKIQYDGSLDELYENDIGEFIRYNLRDVEILVKIEQKKKLIELVRGICHIGHVPYEDYCYSSRFLEGTIVTYLHRQGLVVTNKDPNARDLMEGEQDERFAGAYVKTPHPAKYEWLFSLDLQSLYPSIIMSLNISPETKIGRVIGWNIRDYLSGKLTKITVETDDTTVTLSNEKFKKFLSESNLTVSSNGILYRQDRRGVIPSILEKWFNERLEYKKLMKQALDEGDKQKAEYYDNRQHIQKIFLNSLYGVLGLPIFRFFDIDNALAVTAVGQDVIKNSEEFVNTLFKELGAIPKPSSDVLKYQMVLNEEALKKKEKPEKASEHDWCVYIDTDSLYFSSVPLKHKLKGEIGEATIKLAKFVGNKLNESYSEMALKYFNCSAHKFYIKGETIAKSGIWIAKKRYAMLKTYDLDKGSEVNPPKLVVKGLDIVRSSFPIKFKQFMESFIIELLKNSSKEDIDLRLMTFYNDLVNIPYREIARNTSVKNIFKYGATDRLSEYGKSTPMHVKSTINYNQLLKEFKIDKQYPPIEEGEKIKYVLLKDNPYRLDTIAFKDYGDPPQIVKFIEQYCDHKRLFESELKKKVKDFYDALGWGELPMDTNTKATEFFSF